VAFGTGRSHEPGDGLLPPGIEEKKKKKKPANPLQNGILIGCGRIVSGAGFFL